MPAKKDLQGAMGGRRITSFKAEDKSASSLGVVGNPLRDELEKMAEKLSVQEIAIEHLHDNPYQYLARATLDKDTLEELANSIRENGFYGALLARQKPGSKSADDYELAYGHRRREAAKLTGLETLPVKVIELTDTQMARIMASENFSRQDLTPLGEANVIGHLYDSQNLSVEEVGQIVGKKSGWVRLRLSVHQAPQDIREMVETRPDTLGHIRLLLQIKDRELRTRLIGEILENNLTRDQLEERLNEIREGKPKSQVVTNITNSLPYQNSEKDNNRAIKIPDNQNLARRRYNRVYLPTGEEPIILYMGKPLENAADLTPENATTEGLTLLEKALERLEVAKTGGYTFEAVQRQAINAAIKRLEELMSENDGAI